MAVEFLFRLYDGTGDRKKGDILSIHPYPNKQLSAFDKSNRSNRYGRAVILDMDIKQAKEFFQRHKPILFDVEGKPTVTVRSAYRVNINALNTIDTVAIETKQRVMKDFINLGLIDSITDKAVI